MSEPAARPGHLTVRAGGRTRAFVPGDRVLVGRGAECDVVLVDARVSRRHLELRHDDGWVVRDLDTVNGTWHEDAPVTARPVGAGLAVRLGDPLDGPLVELVAVPAEDRSATGALDAHPAREPVPLGRHLTIGRGTGNTLVLDDPLVSREHARIVLGPRGHVVQDLGSANLTFVNGDCATRATLRDGDVLTCGRTRLVRIADRLHFLPRAAGAGLEAAGLAVLPAAHGEPLAPTLTLRLTGASLLAVVGPSGCGKSTLLRQLAGRRRPPAGRVRYESQDVHANAEVRTRIGYVPHEAAGHPRLTVRQSVSYTAELRRPRDVGRAERAAAVRSALAETGLEDVADRRVSALDEDRRRRLGIACELITDPSLLLVDEPLAGLDPGRAREMTRLLRGLADTGRQVVLATREPGGLDGCDSVLVLAPGAQEAYHGPPSGLRHRFVSTAWADVFEGLATVAEARSDLIAEVPAAPPPPPAATPAGAVVRDPAVRRRALRDARVLMRRRLRLMAADPAATALMALVVPLLVLLALAVADDSGLAVPGAGARRVLVVLVVGVAAAAALPAARDLATERLLYGQERAAGLLPESYLLAKVAVSGGLAAAQAVLAVFLLRALRPGPSGSVLLGLPTVEIAVALAVTALACTLLGMAVAVYVPGPEWALPAVTAATALQLPLCGGLVPLAGEPLLAGPAVLVPARWGFAALAVTVDLGRGAASPDTLWRHGAGTWTLCVLVLAAQGCAAAFLTLRRLRR
ncbi:FHA domain-containing protein [Actinomadura macra]|uniref:FHA domain-containing protein n=1 Tax=Actinomadura macra TaxID=46164 RepID=UPI000830A9A2|nr:FHA domain-containing protein [Actinomadura macra]